MEAPVLRLAPWGMRTPARTASPSRGGGAPAALSLPPSVRRPQSADIAALIIAFASVASPQPRISDHLSPSRSL